MGCKLCRTGPSDVAVERPPSAADPPYELEQNVVEEASHESKAPLSTAVVVYRTQAILSKPPCNDHLHVSTISSKDQEETTHYSETDEPTLSIETTNWDPESDALSDDSLTDVRQFYNPAFIQNSIAQSSPTITGKKRIRSQKIILGKLHTPHRSALSPVENDFGQSCAICSDVSSLSSDLHYDRHGSKSKNPGRGSNGRPYVLTGHDNTESTDYADTVAPPPAVRSSSSALARQVDGKATAAPLSAMKQNLETGLKSASSRLSKSDSRRKAQISDSSSESGDA